MNPQVRAQRYADGRWWTDGVKTVGYAIRCPEMDSQGREVFSVEVLYSEGQKRTRYITVSDVASEVLGTRFHNIAWRRNLARRLERC